MGRQAFASVLGRGLAEAGQLVLDPGALRRLDRVKVVVIDGAALRGDHRAVLKAQGDIPGWDEDRVYEVADALLHAEQPPEPRPRRVARHRRTAAMDSGAGPSAAPAQGLERAELMVDGDIVGSVEVGWEVDRLRCRCCKSRNRTGARVVLRHVAGTEDLAASVAASHPPGTPLLKLVRELRADRGPVLLITALHRDFASTDTLAALAIADVGGGARRSPSGHTVDRGHHHRHRSGRGRADPVGLTGGAADQPIIGKPGQGRHHTGRAVAGHRRT